MPFSHAWHETNLKHRRNRTTSCRTTSTTTTPFLQSGAHRSMEITSKPDVRDIRGITIYTHGCETPWIEMNAIVANWVTLPGGKVSSNASWVDISKWQDSTPTNTNLRRRHGKGLTDGTKWNRKKENNKRTEETQEWQHKRSKQQSRKTGTRRDLNKIPWQHASFLYICRVIKMWVTI